ncbi:unnamed protein product [Cylicocyclus nassatus]|uniref:60S ribosomal protein L32 n=1 Tax=Cylicocyclus nassatus TaxID=53992 RepID=A0AA36HCG3_CYLNA|nr:unnamed protein product [Cylicocyclus nassatus]
MMDVPRHDTRTRLVLVTQKLDEIAIYGMYAYIRNVLVVRMVFVSGTKVKIVKKKVTKFKRHESERYHRLKPNWRKPKGIDNRVRRRFRGMRAMPTIGFGSDKRTKFVLPCGYKKVLVRNVKDLDMLLMQSFRYIERAAQLNIKLTNGHARIRTEESE